MAYEPVYGYFIEEVKELHSLYFDIHIFDVFNMVLWYWVFLPNTNNLHTIVRFQVLLLIISSSSNYFYAIIII